MKWFKEVAAFIFFLPLFKTIVAQNCNYITQQYAVRHDQNNLSYGSAVTFDGYLHDNTLDIYKPVGDNNPSRPLIVWIHGGGFIAGDKKDEFDTLWCREFASRGYVVASIGYRLSMHISANPPDVFQCAGNWPCAFIYDSAEVIRAMYRGMQDAKGAIRFLKSRHSVDSTDLNNVFVAGVSAGGYIALTAAFLDKPGEKPSACFALDSVEYSTSIPYYNGYSSCYYQNNIIDYSRPDLGSVDGTLNTGMYDASVKGVVNLYGALYKKEWIEGANDPAIFSFHRTTDPYVPCGYGKLWQNIDSCFGILAPCTGIADNYAHFNGSCAIRDYLLGMGGNAPFHKEFIEPCTLDCEYCHASDATTNDSAAAFLHELICEVVIATGANAVHSNGALKIIPNPFTELATLQFGSPVNGNATVIITDAASRTCFSKNFFFNQQSSVDLNGLSYLPAGVYFIRVIESNSMLQQIVVKQ